MSKEIDSAALSLLNRILGLAGGGGSPISLLDDYWVNQVIDIGPVVRRSRTIAPSEGIYGMRFFLTHAGADTQAAAVNPYAPGNLAMNGYPAEVPEGYDAWLMGGYGTVDGAAAFTSLQVGSEMPAIQFGASVLQTGGVGAAVQANFPYLSSATVLNLAGIGIFFTNLAGETFLQCGYRLRRGQNLFVRTVSSAALVCNFYAIIALLPSGLGQDVIT